MTDFQRFRRSDRRFLALSLGGPALFLALLAVLTFGAGAGRHGFTTRVLDRPHRPAELVEARVLPDPKLTPGAVYADVTVDDVAGAGFSASVRHVTESEKRQVFRAYGLDPDKVDTSDYEIDHLIELSCGGSNDPANLWPQSLHVNYRGRDMGAIEKDKLEKKVLAAVRDGSMGLAEAQRKLAGDWTKLYRQLVSDEFPPSKSPERPPK